MGRWTILSVGSALAIGLAAFAGSSSASRTAVPANQAPPEIAGAAVEGGVLGASRGRWASSSKTAYAYQWRSCLADGTGCADVAGANDSIYAVRASDVGRTLRVAVTATNRDGSASAVSAATGVIAAVPAPAPRNAALPTISGSPIVGRALTAAVGTWTGTGPIRYAYRWRRCTVSGGDCTDTSTHSAAYRLSSGDAGQTLRVLVTARNAAGTGAALSAATAQVAKPAVQAPQNSSAPAISGTPQQGRQLVGQRGAWRNGPTSFAYAWLRCDRAGGACGAIVGARGTVYSVVAADVGRTIRFQVDAKNAGGTTRAVSGPTAPVQAPAAPVAKNPPVNTSKPTISGTAQEGQTLTGNRGTWTNNPTKFEYTWRRCDRDGNGCDSIGSANGTTYTVTAADIGHRLRFRVKAANADGSGKATSDPTAVVRASAAPQNTSPPTISGTAAEGRTLSGNRGSWSHGPTSFDFQWFRCDRNGNNCAAIGGARNSTYVLTSADVGNTVRLRVTATNSEGSNSSTSVPTGVVQKGAAPPSRGPGCPPGSGNPDQVTSLAPPIRLLVDGIRSDPRVVTRNTSVLVVRFHVTSTCGGSVQGALVYATATPYNQFSIPPEASTGSDGWATLVFRRLAGFPVSRRQQLLAIFVRARKGGESLLAGISTRRLVSIPVRLG